MTAPKSVLFDSTRNPLTRSEGGIYHASLKASDDEIRHLALMAGAGVIKRDLDRFPEPNYLVFTEVD